MSRFFGEIRQVAYLVPDIEAAMKIIVGSAKSIGIEVKG